MYSIFIRQSGTALRLVDLGDIVSRLQRQQYHVLAAECFIVHVRGVRGRGV